MKKLILPILQWGMALVALWTLLFNTTEFNKASITSVTVLLFALAIVQTYLYFKKRRLDMVVTAIDQVIEEKESVTK